MLLLQKLDALKLRYGDGPIAELSQLVRSALD
jgi:hypothetical protein